MIEWKDPPERRTTPWKDIAVELRAHPGEWAIVRRDVPHSTAYVTVSRIRTGSLGGYEPPQAFEARFVATGPTTSGLGKLGDIYARYVGNGDGS